MHDYFVSFYEDFKERKKMAKIEIKRERYDTSKEEYTHEEGRGI